MTVMIQVRNVPEKLHRKLKARAALAGTSLSDYILSELVKVAELPTREEILERARALKPVASPKSAAEIIREERDAR